MVGSKNMDAAERALTDLFGHGWNKSGPLVPWDPVEYLRSLTEIVDIHDASSVAEFAAMYYPQTRAVIGSVMLAGAILDLMEAVAASEMLH